MKAKATVRPVARFEEPPVTTPSDACANGDTPIDSDAPIPSVSRVSSSLLGISHRAGDGVVPGTFSRRTQKTDVRDGVVPGNPFLKLLTYTNAIWRLDYDPLYNGYTEDGFPIPLFDSSLINEDVEEIEFIDEFASKCYRYDPNYYYIDIFFQKRFFKSHETKEKRSSPSALVQSWNSFVERYRQSPSFWMMQFRTIRDRFMSYPLIGVKYDST